MLSVGRWGSTRHSNDEHSSSRLARRPLVSSAAQHTTTEDSTIGVIDDESPEHPYVQVANWLRDQIYGGKIRRRVPSLLELADQTGASVSTVRRATAILTAQGVIRTVTGRGTFVADPLPRRASLPKPE